MIPVNDYGIPWLSSISSPYLDQYDRDFTNKQYGFYHRSPVDSSHKDQ